jgi:hypothetical protein
MLVAGMVVHADNAAPGAFPPVMRLSALDGTNGFVLRGVDADDRSGASVSGAGDVNGDGIADLLIGAYRADPSGQDHAGESYVVFGRATGFPAAFELSSLFPQGGGDGSAGFILKGIDVYDWSGRSLSDAGDVNGDGIDDLIIGAAGGPAGLQDRAGESYVVFGRMTGFPAAFELRSLFPQAGGDGSAGFILKGVDLDDSAGYSVSGAGDVNGDGIEDLVVGSPFADPNGQDAAGESYVVFGRGTGFPATFELRSLHPRAGGDGSTGFVLKGIDLGDVAGNSVSGAGDVNGDGIADLLIGAVGGDPNGRYNAGESYVMFGRATGFPATFELRSLLPQAGGDGSAGFILKGREAEDESGFAVSGAGDVNGDGIADLLIGAWRADPGGDRSGESYVVFGRATGFPPTFDLWNLHPQGGGDGSAGFILRGIGARDASGWAVSGAGDVNRDGIDDLLIGALGADHLLNPEAGETYVVFGRTSGLTATFDLSGLYPQHGGDGSAGIVLQGIYGGDNSGYSVSDAGDVNGDGIADLLIGAYRASPNGQDFAGETYVVFGRAQPLR